MRVSVVVMFGLSACGGDDGGSTNRGDGGMAPSDGTDGVVDAAVDAAPPSTTQLGLVQLARVGGGASTSLAAGFYDETGGAGCTWTYQGACSLAICEPSAGLAPVSAGTITATPGATTPVMLVPAVDGTYSFASVTGIDTGTSITIAGAGATVGAFTSPALTMPAQLAVSAPAQGAIVPRTAALVVSWTSAPGTAYVNVSQGTPNGTPYPSSYLRTIRCSFSSQTGSGIVPMALLAQLEPGMAFATAAASAEDTQTVGGYVITTRVLAVDQTRTITVQ